MNDNNRVRCFMCNKFLLQKYVLKVKIFDSEEQVCPSCYMTLINSDKQDKEQYEILRRIENEKIVRSTLEDKRDDRDEGVGSL